MALRYFLAIPVKAWQEMKADYEREIPVRMKRPVFSADPESAALAPRPLTSCTIVILNTVFKFSTRFLLPLTLFTPT